MSEPSGETPARRCLRAAHVVTASARGTIEDGAVVIDGSRIIAVGPAADVLPQVPAATVETYPNATPLPGIIDAHAHPTLAGDRRTYEQRAVEVMENLERTIGLEPMACRLRTEEDAKPRATQPTSDDVAPQALEQTSEAVMSAFGGR